MIISTLVTLNFKVIHIINVLILMSCVALVYMHHFKNYKLIVTKKKKLKCKYNKYIVLKFLFYFFNNVSYQLIN